MVYQWKSGYSGAVPAQVAGERLAEIARANGDRIEAPGVVEDARPEGSPLHPCFTWDDAHAAEQFRLVEARQLIRNVYVVPVPAADDAPTPEPVLCYVNARTQEGRGYITTVRAVSDDDLRRQVEDEAIRAFEALRRRYAHIRSLSAVFKAIDLVLKRKAARGRKAVAS